MSTTFKRTIEDFDCEHCGAKIKGTGYTNHCSRCLWSKHVDEHPGDRAAKCKGLMEPISVEQKHGRFVILHRCVVCGHKKRNESSSEDSVDALIQLTVQHVQKRDRQTSH
jgi:hypothetical protein